MKPYGRSGVWGYLFKYQTGELCLYQLEENEMLGPATTLMMLTSNDWRVLRHMLAFGFHNREATWDDADEEVAPPPPPAKRMKCSTPPQLGTKAVPPPQGTEAPPVPRKSGFTIVWHSKNSPAGQWFLRASIQIPPRKKESAGEDIVLECFNSDCRIFRTLLSLPLAAWLVKLDELDASFSALFCSCHNWMDLLVVKKALFF